MDSGGDDSASLRFADQNAELVRMVEGLVARSNIDALHSLAAGLEAEITDLNARLSRAEGALRYVAFTLAAIPGEEYVTALLQLLPNRPFFAKHLRELAAIIVSSQPPEVTQGLIQRYGESHEYAQAVGQYQHLELMGLLVHEAVVRGQEMASLPAALHVCDRLRARQHPLSWLPLTVLPIEDNLKTHLATYNRRARAWLVPEERTSAGQTHIPSVSAVRPNTREITRSSAAESIKAAFAEWYNVETRVFRLDPAIAPDNVSIGLLLNLGLECLEGAAEFDVVLKRTTANPILGALFDIAANGGPFDTGHGGAYGRLEAWRSLGALIGAGANEPVEAVAARAETCHWFAFESESGWFYHAGWDVGFVVLRPDGVSLAVLAATASD